MSITWPTKFGELTPKRYFSTFGANREVRATKVHIQREFDGPGRYKVTYKAKSQTQHFGTYHVVIDLRDEDESTCTCQDFKNGWLCKHIFAGFQHQLYR